MQSIMQENEEFIDKCPVMKYPKCLECKNKVHTEQEHKKKAKKEYMRAYMFGYNEGKVAYRRKKQEPKIDNFYKSMIPYDGWDTTQPIYLSDGVYVFPDGRVGGY